MAVSRGDAHSGAYGTRHRKVELRTVAQHRSVTPGPRRRSSHVGTTNGVSCGSRSATDLALSLRSWLAAALGCKDGVDPRSPQRIRQEAMCPEKWPRPRGIPQTLGEVARGTNDDSRHRLGSASWTFSALRPSPWSVCVLRRCRAGPAMRVDVLGVLRGPGPQSTRGLTQRKPERREAILDPRRHFRKNLSTDQSIRFESAQLRCEDFLRHAWELLLETREPKRSVLQRLDDEQSPFLGDLPKNFASKSVDAIVIECRGRSSERGCFLVSHGYLEHIGESGYQSIPAEYSRHERHNHSLSRIARPQHFSDRPRLHGHVWDVRSD